MEKELDGVMPESVAKVVEQLKSVPCWFKDNTPGWRVDLIEQAAALLTDYEAMTARALTAEADVTRQMAIANESVNALEAMRKEPTAEEVEVVAAAYQRSIENPEMVPCDRCDGRGYHHGFGEHGHDPDWCVKCGGGSVMLKDEHADIRAALTAFLAARGK